MRASSTRSDARLVARAVSDDAQATEALGRLIARLNVRHKRLLEAQRRLNLARVKLAGFVDRIDEMLGAEL